MTFCRRTKVGRHVLPLLYDHGFCFSGGIPNIDCAWGWFSAAKQAAFEEQNRIKNQFRALDDDEVDFLDEVRQKKRQEEELVKKETEQGLRAFREAQKDRGEPGAEEDGGGLEEKQNDGQEESWGVGRKRKRAREKEVKGVRRKASEGEGHREDGNDDAKPVESKTQSTKGDDKVKSDKPAQAAAAPQAKQPALGLVDYGSDSDD